MEKHYKHLTAKERNQIHRYCNEGFSFRAISRRLKRLAERLGRK